MMVGSGMVYPNPTSPWASAPLLINKPDAEKSRFTLLLRPVNRFKIGHPLPMKNVDK